MNDLFKKICLTNDIYELYDIFEKKHKEREDYFFNKYNKTYIDLFNTRDLVLFGAGMIGSYVAAKLKAIGKLVKFFCDNNSSKWGKRVEGIIVKSPQHLIENNENILVLITVVQPEEICRQLEALGIDYMFYDTDGFVAAYNSPTLYHNKEKVIDSFNVFQDSRSQKIFLEYLKARFFPIGNFGIGGNIFLKQYTTGTEYFDIRYFSYSDNEVMADIGAYTGDTIVEFKKFMLEIGKDEPFVYAFEPDEENCKTLAQNMEYLSVERYELIRKCVGSDDTNNQKHVFNNCRDFAGSINIPMCRLDTILKDINVTFIKADVEGFELDVLKGAHYIIKTKQPKLAICVYHLTHDLFEIPLYIKQLNPNYKLFLGMHGNDLRGVICYAYA